MAHRMRYNATRRDDAEISLDEIEAAHARWAGKKVTIVGVGGNVSVDSAGSVRTQAGNCSTSFEVVSVPRNGGTWVAFRVTNVDNDVARNAPDKYLTIVMYGDEQKQNMLRVLADASPLLPEMIGEVVDYSVDTSTADENFEGAGFNYSPMTAQPGPLNILQLLQMVPVGGGRYGVRTTFRTYWRSQHWEGVVSQSPHREGDETWYITESTGLH